MSMVGRRAMMRSAALVPLAQRRRHQVGWESNSVFQVLIVPGGKGGGVFVYNGAPAAGNPPVMFSVAPGTTKDPLGNNLETNANSSAVFGAGTVGGGQIIINSTGVMTFDNGVTVGALPRLLPDTTASLLLQGGQNVAGDQQTWLLDLAKADSGQAVAQLVLGRAGSRPVPGTPALLEVQDQMAISSAAAGGLVEQITSTVSGITNPLVRWLVNAAGDSWLGTRIAGDTANRIVVDSDGTGAPAIRFGPGNAAPDAVIRRIAANVLRVNNALALPGVGAPAAFAGTAELFAAPSNQPGYVNPQGLIMRLAGCKTAGTAKVTVTAAALTNLFNDTIPANDAEAGAVYEIEAFGNGTWGSTQQQLTLGIRFGATDASVIGTNVAIAAGALAASAAFQWFLKIRLVCLTTGAAATWRASMTGAIQETASPLLPGAAATNSVAFSAGTGPTDITLDSTVAEIFGLSAQWASVTGAPTITKVAGTSARKA